ncbi:hypothetical protein FHT44_004988 [Mycolicibacterium sp. BK634]|nr:hypothetical protein [Mycolicibacterium sp. BK634]
MSTNKWRVRKSRNRWIVREPGGSHFGTYLTWHEAMAQATGRTVIQGRSANGGSFALGYGQAYDSRSWSRAFGFVGPVRC